MATKYTLDMALCSEFAMIRWVITSYVFYIRCAAGVTCGTCFTACTPHLGEFPIYALYGKHGNVYCKCLYNRCTLFLYVMGTTL